LPWSITEISSASASAVLHQAPDQLPDVLALGRVQPGGRFVQVDHGRSADQTRGQVEPPPHAAGVGLGQPLPGVGQIELAEQMERPGPGVAATEIEQPADQDQVLQTGEVLVDRGVLAGQPDPTANRPGLGGDVQTGDGGPALVGA
jgi:hypothetical protein